MMSFYLAAQYNRREQVEEKAEDLRRRGFKVVSSWHDRNAGDSMVEDGVGGDSSDLRGQQFAIQDLMEVDMCDAIISFTEERGASNAAAVRGGRHVEFGYALKGGKLMYIVGSRENIFHTYPNIRFFTGWGRDIYHVIACDLSWKDALRDEPMGERWMCYVCLHRMEEAVQEFGAPPNYYSVDAASYVTRLSLYQHIISSRGCRIPDYILTPHGGKR